MAKQEHVFVGAFSNKALKQLKKTFELSAEERFEARKIGGDSMAGGKDAGKKAKGGILRAVAGLALVLANLAVMFGTLMTGVVLGFVGEIKRLMSFTKLGKWIGKQWTSITTLFKTRWTALITSIKESKLVKGITSGWQRFTAKLSAVFTPLMDWIGVKDIKGGAAGGKVQGPKQQGKMMQLLQKFKAFFTKWPRTLAVGKALGRFVPWLWPMILVWEGVSGLVEGWKDAEAKDPDATFMEKLKGAVFGEKGFVSRMWNFLIVETGNILGIISKWITENLLRLFGFDKAADKIAKQDWNWGDMIENIRLKIWDFLGLGATPEKDSIFFKMFQAFDDISDWWAELDIGKEILGALKRLKDKFLGIFRTAENLETPVRLDATGQPLKQVASTFGQSPEGPGALDTAKNIAGKGVNAVKGFGADVGQTFTDTKNSLITGGISGAKTAKKKVDDLINTITSWNPFSGGEGEDTSPTMPESWKRRSSKIVSGLADSTFGSRIKEFVSKMWNEHGIDAQVYSGTRGAAEQEAAFKSGASKAKHGKSLHNYGAAVDFFFGHKGAKSDWTGPWDLAGKVAKSLGLRWGGDFKKFKDRPHLQTDKNWQEAAKSGLPLAMEKGGIVTRPQLAYIGEGLHPEAVIPLPNFKPGVDPANMTNIMRGMGGAMSDSVGGGGTITTVVDASSNTSNATVLAVGNGPHPAPIDDGLHR